MAKFNMDFTEAKEIIVCGKGEHDFKITSAELKSVQGKDGTQKQKIEFTCEVFEGGEDSGAKVFHSIFLTNPTGLYMFMSRLGIKVEKKVYNDLDTNLFVGKLFTANVEHESYTKSDGTIRNKAVIIDSTIRKYNNLNTVNNTPDGLNDDSFAEFGDNIEISDDDISF